MSELGCLRLKETALTEAKIRTLGIYHVHISILEECI